MKLLKLLNNGDAGEIIPKRAAAARCQAGKRLVCPLRTGSAFRLGCSGRFSITLSIRHIGDYLRVGNSSNPNTAQANIQRQPDIDRCASRSTVFEGRGIESAEVPINAAAKPSPTRQAQRQGQGPRLGQAQLPAPQPRPPCLVWVWEGHRASPHAR
jgi:hypothetical protein